MSRVMIDIAQSKTRLDCYMNNSCKLCTILNDSALYSSIINVIKLIVAEKLIRTLKMYYYYFLCKTPA